jgi:kynurenine formamidase
MNSGWDQRVGDSQAFLNADAEAVLHFPGFSGEAAQFLIEERDIVGVGVDTLSLDVGMSTDFAAHLTFLPAGKYGLELMANLDDVPPAGATLIVGAPKHQGGSGGPARVFAVS